MTTKRQTKLIHEGDFVAEVEVELVDEAHGWSPTLSPEDACKLDDVRLALRNGDVETASSLAKVYSLTPVGG